MGPITTFSTSSFGNVLIYSGFDLKEDSLRKVKDSSLKGNALSKAIQAATDSYNKYQANLMKTYTFSQFLGDVVADLSTLKGTYHITQCPTVGAKLEKVAKKYILEKESKYNPVSKFFHRLFQFLFKGHGFRTEGEWGLKLAESMVMQGFEEVKKQLEKRIFASTPLEAETYPDFERDQINSLPDDQFKNLLHDVIFAKKQEPSSSFSTPPKLAFYQILAESKKKIFDDALLARKDWYDQACNIIYGDKEEKYKEFAHFVTGKIKLLNDPELNCQEISKIGHTYGKYINADRKFNTLVAAAVKFYMKKGSYIEISKLFDSLHKDQFLNLTTIPLTPSEIKVLKEKIDLNKFPNSQYIGLMEERKKKWG